MEENKKISVEEYLNDNSLLEVTYLPFDTKLGIVSNILNSVIESVGGLNSSLLRRISTEVIIENITNIDMNIEDENKLKGFDQLCYNNQLENLKLAIGNEYVEFDRILNERISDYIRIETNPAITITGIYNQLKEYAGMLSEFVKGQIDNIDVDEIARRINTSLNKGGE